MALVTYTEWLCLNRAIPTTRLQAGQPDPTLLHGLAGGLPWTHDSLLGCMLAFPSLLIGGSNAGHPVDNSFQILFGVPTMERQSEVSFPDGGSNPAPDPLLQVAFQPFHAHRRMMET